jgi:hypothetical protein
LQQEQDNKAKDSSKKQQKWWVIGVQLLDQHQNNDEAEA